MLLQIKVSLWSIIVYKIQQTYSTMCSRLPVKYIIYTGKADCIGLFVSNATLSVILWQSVVLVEELDITTMDVICTN